MSSATQKLLQRDIRAGQEVRRGTVLTNPKRLNYDPAQVNSNLYVVDVNIGGSRPMRNVPVKSISGLGGRSFALPGKAVEVQRNAGGRWIVIGPADRVQATGTTQLFNEASQSTVLSNGVGFRQVPRFFNYWQIAGNAWGSRGFGDTIILDGDGNEVIL